MKIKKLILIITSFLLAAGAVQASVQEDEDFAIWSQNDLDAKLGEHWKIRAGEEVRFREHAGLTYFDTHAGAAYKVSKYLTTGAEYLQVRQTRLVGRKDIWFWEERPRFYLTPQITWKGFALENRNLFEFRLKLEIENTFRYRNLFALTAPWKWTRFEIQPYTTNEIFFESNRNGLVEDRFACGLKYHLWREFYGSLFYLRQFSKNSLAKWKELNVLGIGTKISF